MSPRPRRYAAPDAFKRSLEDRIREAAAREGVTINRFRQRLIFERFLARMSRHLGDAAIAKGGVALELRLERARATKDVDFRMSGTPENVLESLRVAGRLDLGDHLQFIIGAAPDDGAIAGDGVVYEGVRFRAEARLAGRLFGDPFGVDVAFGDVLTGSVEEVTGSDFLSFAGIPAPRIKIYPRETHVAEKLHAYTLPRPRPNSRVKDLPDIALLASTGAFDGGVLRRALEATFAFRQSHPLPALFPEPPSAWSEPYARMARENDLPWATLEEVTRASRAFLEPPLRGVPREWDPDTWQWRP